MKILFVNTNIGYGGASKMMVTVANHMSEHADVTFLTFRNSDVLQELSDKVKHVHNTLYTNKFKPIEILGQIRELRKLIRKEKFDLAVAFLHPSHYMLTLAAKGTDTKVLLSERGDPTRVKKLIFKALKRFLQTADAFVFQTEQAKASYSLKAQANSVVIPNPIPDKKIPQLYEGEREKVISNVARLDILQKRQDVLIKAFDKLSEKFPEYELHLYGDGVDEKKLREISAQTKSADKIKFMGVSDNVMEDIRKHSLFVLSSDFEGIPNALLEAMAVGVPCVSCDCSPGGARVIIDSGENGFIVPCGDVDALCDAMEKVLADDELAREFSKKAVKVTDKFEKSKILNEWENFINTVVS